MVSNISDTIQRVPIANILQKVKSRLLSDKVCLHTVIMITEISTSNSRSSSHQATSTTLRRSWPLNRSYPHATHQVFHLMPWKLMKSMWRRSTQASRQGLLEMQWRRMKMNTNTEASVFSVHPSNARLSGRCAMLWA